MRYIGDAAVMLEHYGEGQYEAAIALVRGSKRGEIVWEEPIHARPTGDPDSDDVIDRIAASAVALAAFESGNDAVRDATAWAMDGSGSYEVVRGNPEGPPPGVPWSKGKRNPAGLTTKGERMYEHVKASYAGSPRAKEIAARTVLARASEGTPGLRKNPSHAEILRAARGGARTPAVEAWIHQYPKTWENMRRRSR
jgi:hypothetical protein